MPAIGPELPEHLRNVQRGAASDDEDEDAYAPALPPDLLAAPPPGKAPSSEHRSHPVVLPEVKTRVAGAALPPPPTSYPSTSLAHHHHHPRHHHQRNDEEEEDGSDEEVGPMPLPAGVSLPEKDGVTEFLEREERRRKLVEEAAKPKKPQREEWMLVPPTSTDLLASLDPTRMKARQFSTSSTPRVSRKPNEPNLWTETPAERQQRIKDEVSGKRRRVQDEDAGRGDVGSSGDAAEQVRKRKRDEEIRKGVEMHTKKIRGPTLLEQHGVTLRQKEKEKDQGDEPPVIWDHARDMSVGGRLMDDKSRDKFVREARGLGERFGSGKSGGFL